MPQNDDSEDRRLQDQLNNLNSESDSKIIANSLPTMENASGVMSYKESDGDIT